MSRPPPAVVIGAGVVGAGVAWALCRAGLEVTIVDRAPGPGLGSTSASSAIVHLHYSTVEGVAVAWEAMHAWKRWPDHLGVTDPAGLARYVSTGALVLDTPGYDSARVLSHFERMSIPYQVLSAAQIRDRFPYLSTGRFHPPRLPNDEQFWAEPVGAVGGFFTPEAGFVDDPGLAAHNLWQAATEAGARSQFRARVGSVDRSDTAVTGVTLADGRRLPAGIVVNAAGPQSAAINDLAGVLDDFSVSTRPMRQEVHLLPGPPELSGGIGPAIGDGDLGTYFRWTPGGDVLVGSQEPDCDPLEGLDDADEYEVGPTVEWYERQSLRLAKRMPSIVVPNRPTGLAGVYDVTDDWIPIYDRTSLDGYFVAIGTSGNQFKNAPVIGAMVTAIITDWLAGGDHDREPVIWRAPTVNVDVDLGHYSRRRQPNAESSNSVLG